MWTTCFPLDYLDLCLNRLKFIESVCVCVYFQAIHNSLDIFRFHFPPYPAWDGYNTLASTKLPPHTLTLCTLFSYSTVTFRGENNRIIMQNELTTNSCPLTLTGSSWLCGDPHILLRRFCCLSLCDEPPHLPLSPSHLTNADNLLLLSL